MAECRRPADPGVYRCCCLGVPLYRLAAAGEGVREAPGDEARDREPTGLTGEEAAPPSAGGWSTLMCT